jgi:hypothetical protein
VRRAIGCERGLVATPYDGETDEDRCGTIWWAFQKGARRARLRGVLRAACRDTPTRCA